MPILIKGSGGAQEAPAITVSSSGLITAKAGDETTTKQLSSADDANFSPENIKSGVSIFGKTGSLASMGVVQYVEAAAYGDGSKSITFNATFPDFGRVVDILCFYPGGFESAESSELVLSYLSPGLGSTATDGLIRNSLQNKNRIGNGSNSNYSYSTSAITLTIYEGADEVFASQKRYVLRVAYM